MRKIFATFALLFILSASAFAEGDIALGGGRSCPQPEPDQPPPACTEPTPPGTGQSSSTATNTGSSEEESDDSSVLGDVVDYLRSLFG